MRWIQFRPFIIILHGMRGIGSSCPMPGLFLVSIFITCAVEALAADILFEDVTEKSGVNFQHYDGSSGRKYVMETTCSGVALFDYDGDGWLDLYFVNGAKLPGATRAISPTNKLYKNNGDMTFTDVTEEAGVGDRGYGYGCVAADYDNDGDMDFYVVNFGPNVLYRNHGDGTFTDVAKEAGVDDPRQGAAACFIDIENDGDLDLYVTNYLVIDYEKHKICYHDQYPIYCSRLDFPFEKDSLYRNNGGGTFTDITEEAGMDAPASTGMSVVCTDYDNNGFQDLFVVNDAQPNYFFHNQGGRFEEVSLYTGVAYDLNGDPQGNMGADFKDYDHDGFIDLITTNYQDQMVAVYRNIQGQLFQDVSLDTKIGPPTVPHVTWGTGFYDFDLDGWRDCFVAAGHLQDNVDLYDNTTSYKVQNYLFHNKGKGTFENISKTSGPGLKIKKSSRGAAFGDLDNDGDIDIVINNARERADILENVTKTENHWLLIHPVGIQSNRNGVGARITIRGGGLKQIDDVRAGGTYAGMNDLRVHFGLGKVDTIDELMISWPSGTVDRIRDVAADQILMVTEGMSVKQ